MKKFMFTAIAMVAFVGSSMANTIDANKSVPIKMVKAKKFKKNNCDTIKKLAYELATSEGADDCTAEYYSDLVYANCMK